MVVFKTESCRACTALLKELENKGVEFSIETDMEFALEHNIRSAPALLLEGVVYRTPQEIVSVLKTL